MIGDRVEAIRKEDPGECSGSPRIVLDKDMGISECMLYSVVEHVARIIAMSGSTKTEKWLSLIRVGMKEIKQCEGGESVSEDSESVSSIRETIVVL